MQKSKKRRPQRCFPWNFQTFSEEPFPEEHNLEKLLVYEIHFFREELKLNSQMKVFHKKTFLKYFVRKKPLLVSCFSKVASKSLVKFSKVASLNLHTKAATGGVL